MEIYEVVIKLVGPIRPIGSHGTDQERLANLKVLTELVDRLLFDIDSVTPSADRQEASMKAIGAHAKEFMERVQST